MRKFRSPGIWVKRVGSDLAHISFALMPDENCFRGKEALPRVSISITATRLPRSENQMPDERGWEVLPTPPFDLL